MKIDQIQFAKIKLQWEILKYGTVNVHVEEMVNKTIDKIDEHQVYQSFTEKNIIKERLISIRKKIPLLLKKENYEELARLKRIYEQLLERYNKYGNKK